MSNIRIGGTLYIRCKDCKLTKTPKANDVSYGFLMLQPGTAVTWLGQAAEDNRFHKISYKGQIGYTLGPNLSTKQFAEFDSGDCTRCNGSGQISQAWGASVGFIFCPACNGKGTTRKPISAQAFASHGVGIKG